MYKLDRAKEILAEVIVIEKEIQTLTSGENGESILQILRLIA
jgi:hypothetical protein